jgi:glutamate/tyrosine decarboxylase-like PLP-dependent enzyme
LGPLLEETARRAAQYLSILGDRPVAPRPEDLERLAEFDEPLPAGPSDPAAVLAQLDRLGSPATIASAGGRYFGFVQGGVLPATLAANWMAGAWDQNAALEIMTPIGAKLEQVALHWLLDIFGFPPDCAAGFVTGATMANFTCLAAARHCLLARLGWDVEESGLFDAPLLSVVVGEEVHVCVLKALALLGLGRARVTRVPTDGQGRIIAAALPKLDSRTIVCIQAGNVNTGAFDPAGPICERAKEAGAWVHVDGAFGLWAAAAPERAHLMAGYAGAGSWATDCHKWLNVPYDSGLAFVRGANDLQSAMAIRAAYLTSGDQRQPDDYTPEASRRARGIEVWAALKSLGRSGLAHMIERNCRQAQRFADGLRAAGYEILNEVVLNQVMVSFGDADTTKEVIAAIQQDGVCWCGGTTWHGRPAMRISVSSWATTDEDVELSLAAVIRQASRYNRS